MLKLSNREWKEFFIGDKYGSFQVSSSSSGIDKNKLQILEGDDSYIPYITRTDINNGVNLFVSEKQKDK